MKIGIAIWPSISRLILSGAPEWTRRPPVVGLDEGYQLASVPTSVLLLSVTGALSIRDKRAKSCYRATLITNSPANRERAVFFPFRTEQLPLICTSELNWISLLTDRKGKVLLLCSLEFVKERKKLRTEKLGEFHLIFCYTYN